MSESEFADKQFYEQDFELKLPHGCVANTLLSGIANWWFAMDGRNKITDLKSKYKD